MRVIPGRGGEGGVDGHWHTLDAAFAAYGFPPENLALVRRLTDAIGIDHYEGIPSRSYLKAIRRDGRRALYIAFGYTGGIDSEQEILDAVGDVQRGVSDDHRDWWVHHPVNRIRDGQAIPGLGLRDHGVCPSCFVALPASGVCDSCGA